MAKLYTKPPFIYDVAREKLEESGGGVWGHTELKIDFSGNPARRGPIDSFRVVSATNVTRSWTAYFYNTMALMGFARLPIDLTREEAEQAAQNLMDLENIRSSK